MVKYANPEVAVNFIVHDDVEIFARTLPQNLHALGSRTCKTFETVITIDGAETAPVADIIKLAESHGIDEIRLRYRSKNCATGDPSNNGHVQALSDRTPYLLSIESDVVVFRTHDDFDILDACIGFFDKQPAIPLIHLASDHECWCWPLHDVGPTFAQGVRSVNRVASHFLFYNMVGFRAAAGRPALDTYHDTNENWNNVEDVWSALCAAPAGPGIAFPDGWPMRVFHCDEKQGPTTVHYKRDRATRMRTFAKREIEVSALISQQSEKRGETCAS